LAGAPHGQRVRVRINGSPIRESQRKLGRLRATLEADNPAGIFIAFLLVCCSWKLVKRIDLVAGGELCSRTTVS
jgi:hypothetical protein